MTRRITGCHVAKCFHVCCLIALFPLYSHAANIGPADPDANGNTEKRGLFAALNRPNQAVSARLTRIVNSIDGFFSGEKVYHESTGSYLRLTADTIWDEESGRIGFNSNIRLKLNLPRSNEKYKFVLESDPQKNRDTPTSEAQDSLAEAADNSDYYAGIQRQGGGKPNRWLSRTTLGVKLRTPLDYFIRARVSRTYSLGQWLLRLEEGVFWFDSLGSGVDSAVEFDNALDDSSLFRARTYLRWLEDDDNLEMSEVLSVFHTLSKRRILVYQAGVYAITRPSPSVTEYVLQLRYRQSIHDQFLFAEIIPQILYPRDRDFHPQPALIFRLEWVFDG